MKKVNIAILGLGTVGGGTFRILQTNKKEIEEKSGLDICVAKILDRGAAQKQKEYNLPASAFAADIEEIINDKTISIVVETIGGISPAKEFVLRVLGAGKSVVTANKELLAKYFEELMDAARSGGAGLYFEASCVGGVPIINTLTNSLQGDNILRLFGIVNGTTNYILSKMTSEGLSYDEALRGAREKGYAEADPTADVEGYDAMYKMSILSSLAFNTSVPIEKISRGGITKITDLDIKHGKDLGYRLKLLAIGKKTDGEIEVRVRPTFIPEEHPLASVRGAFNAVFLTGNAVDEIMLLGRGAGALPTGSAVVNDIINAARAKEHRYTAFRKDAKFKEDYNAGFYIRLRVLDQAGVLSAVSYVFGRHGVSISTVMQKGSYNDNTVPIIYITHNSNEARVYKALEEISRLDVVKCIDSVIDVEE